MCNWSGNVPGVLIHNVFEKLVHLYKMFIYFIICLALSYWVSTSGKVGENLEKSGNFGRLEKTWKSQGILRKKMKSQGIRRGFLEK